MEKQEVKYPNKAVWNHRNYERHNIDDDVKEFMGWRLIKQLADVANKQVYKELVAYTFLTGGRISEVLGLMLNMFELCEETEPPILIVNGMPLEKRFEVTDVLFECKKCESLNPKNTYICQNCGGTMEFYERHYQTKKYLTTRNGFSIRTDEPLADILLESLERHRTSKKWLIFESPYACSYTDRAYSRQWAYWVLRELGKKLPIPMYIYPHRLRAERASQLGRKLGTKDLLEWFSWENVNTAKRYSKKGAVGLAEAQGVKVKNWPITTRDMTGRPTENI